MSNQSLRADSARPAEELVTRVLGGLGSFLSRWCSTCPVRCLERAEAGVSREYGSAGHPHPEVRT